MLLNNLYTIESLAFSESKDKVIAHILLNRDHRIFEGHFPGNPILPGVCTVQIASEIIGKAMGKELMLTHAGNIKYLGFINPVLMPKVQFDLFIKPMENGVIGCSAMVSAGGNTLCSFKGEYASI
jgi:3-hydroxyacyl-[acyl-carrier-protein] dehydratase